MEVSFADIIMFVPFLFIGVYTIRRARPDLTQTYFLMMVRWNTSNNSKP
jgi:hypothetical protein